MTLTWKAGVGALLISVLPTLGLSVLSFHSARQALNEHIYDGLTTMTQEHLSGLEDLLHRAATDIKTWSNLLILQDVLTDDEEGDASEELARLQHRYPHFINLVAVNSAGVIVSTAGGEHIGQDLSSTPAFRMTNQGQTYQSKLKEATLAGKPALIFAEPIFADYDRDSVIGSLIAYLDWGAIDGSLTQTKVLGATQSAQHRLLVTARGQEKPLYDSIVTAGSKNAHLPATAGIERVHIDKRDYLIGTALTQGRGDLINPEWAFHALVSIDAAYASVDSLKSKFALLSVIIVCVSILFASLLARSVVRPIGSLEQAARKLAEGEFTTPLPGPRHDEIGVLTTCLRSLWSRHRFHRVLTTSFASMCNAIMTNESKLTDAANRHKRTSEQLQIALEEKVTAETASLHKSQFLANMSHEIRTPMNGVLGVTDLLLHTDLTDPQRSLTKTIRRSGKSLLSIINDILDFSKREAGHLQIDPADFNLLMAIEDINGLLRDSAMTKGVEYHCYVANTVMRRVRGDQHRIRQVLTNLIGNAIKFTSAGEVTIHVTCDGTGVDRITRFEVRDTGIGMTPDALERVFESFHQGDETTTRKFGGTGLGLTISKQLVEMMGGDIGVESTEDVGSVFWFTVPLEEARPQVPKIEAVASQSSLPEPAGNPPARVLLAEDNAVNKLVAEGMLRLLGYEFRSVENGREVLTALNDERFDVVLMDCHMLLMDGFDTTQAIRQQEAEGPCQRLPIVALTANAMEGDEEKCLAAGMDDYLAKPFEQEDLGETLRRWVA